MSSEKTLLRPLPTEPFDTALTLTPRVDRYAQVMVRCNQYSVPARFIGHRLRVKLSASHRHGIRRVLCGRPAAPMRCQCSICDDAGVISNWKNSAYDLRRRQLTLAKAANEIVIPNEVAAALRELQLLDADCERLVFQIRAHHDHALLTATDDDLEELIGSVAAEANHEPNRRRQQRLDAAFDALNDAATDRW